jgi:23S rRNA pseudouridine2605 synthase
MINQKKSERIAKSIAATGYCSRRHAEKLITMGEVTVNGKKVSTPAFFVDKDDKIIIKGKLIQNIEKTQLFIFHKPKGVIVSRDDPQKRKTIYDFLPINMKQYHYVGRLDYNTEGLLLITNDGKLKRYLELPLNKIERIYKVKIHGSISNLNKIELLKGITINNIKYGPVSVDIIENKGKNSWINVKIHEGKNREIRKIMEHYNLIINDLIRVKFGPFNLNKLARGKLIEIEERILSLFIKSIGGL